jgi:hypothetical protein
MDHHAGTCLMWFWLCRLRFSLHSIWFLLNRIKVFCIAALLALLGYYSCYV